MMKKGDVIVVVDDDEVRTSVSHNPVTAILCTGELFLRTQYK
jgi:hypothetical protein